MNADFETPVAALFDHMVEAAQITFTADTVAGETLLTDVLYTDRLFAGLPVFGAGLARGTVISSIDHDASTVTLSSPAGETGTATELSTGFLTTSRRVAHWSQVAEQPAFYLRRIGVTDELDQLFPVTTLECEAWIYSNAGENPDIAPDEVLTGLERILRESLAPDADYGDPRFTIGGLVYHCRFEGRSDISPGDQGPQAIARMPIRITLP